MDISIIEGYTEFEEQHSRWFEETVEKYPDTYMDFLRSSLGMENIHKLWELYNVDPIHSYLDNIIRIEDENEVRVLLERLPLMFEELDGLGYFVINPYAKMKAMEIMEHGVFEYPSLGDIWISIYQNFFDMIENNMDYYPSYIQKDIYLELVSELVILCINYEDTNEIATLDIYLKILEHVFFSNKLKTGYICDPVIFNLDNLREDLYEDIHLLINRNTRFKGKFVWEYITNYKKKGLSYNVCLAYLSTTYRIDNLGEIYDKMIKLRERMKKAVNMRSMRKRLPYLRDKKIVLDELVSLPAGQIVSHFIGGEEYNRRLHNWG
jgi:hypothetical protein